MKKGQLRLYWVAAIGVFWVFLVSPILAEAKMSPPTVNGLLQVWAKGGAKVKKMCFLMMSRRLKVVA